MITSTQNERVKLAHLLGTNARARRKNDQILLEGARLVADAVQYSPAPPDFILYDPDVIAPDGFGGSNAPNILEATAEVIRHISTTETPQGVIAVMKTPVPALPKTLTRVLVLDAIGDPGNLGTILRTAAGAGTDGVLLAPGCADAFSPKALRAGMGAQLRIPALEAAWVRIALVCKDLTVYLADMVGDVAYDRADWNAPHALIIGSEAHGASPQAEQLAAHTVYIPMANATESLNAASAAAILLFEGRRGRD